MSISAHGRIALKQARHPLLVLAKEHVIANDLVLDEATRVLIISGPNTGGKTVTLKNTRSMCAHGSEPGFTCRAPLILKWGGSPNCLPTSAIHRTLRKIYRAFRPT